ncbi:MAG: cellobiose phosphorylase, partial [Anaerolineae bacterium]
WYKSEDPDRDFQYWDVVATAREGYRSRIRLGFDGTTKTLALGELRPILEAFEAKVSAGLQRAVEMNASTSPGIPPTYFAYTVTDFDLINGNDGEPQHDEQGRPYVKAKGFTPTALPLFLEGPVHALKVQPDVASARSLYGRIQESDLYDRELGMYKVNAPLKDQSHEIGRARAFTPGWLENESVFLHMEYKYLLEVLKAGLYEEFFEDAKHAVVCFQDPAVYGRSPLENSSFLVSSAHPDESLHGAGFIARLTGATAEFLSMWTTMMAGPKPFFVENGELCLAFRPALPGWLFDAEGKVTFTFLGRTPVTINNPSRLDTWLDEEAQILRKHSTLLHIPGQGQIEFSDGIVRAPYAEMVRSGQVEAIELLLT